MFSFLASCAIVSRVSERARRLTLQAVERRADVERLYELSRQMMLHEEAENLFHDLPRLIERIFALEGVVLYLEDRDRFYASRPETTESLLASMRLMATSLDPVPQENAGYEMMPLQLGLRAVGAMAWRPASLSREVASAVSAEVAIVLARTVALETTARMEAAREGERLRAALVDSLTHELRTPLTSIRAAATTLRQGQGLDEAARQDLVEILDEEASSLDRLIGEAVEMAEIDAHALQVRRSPHDPRSLLEQAVEDLERLLAGHKVTIDAEDAADPVWFDPHLLSRVLRHLLENATGHTPPGTAIRLRCWRAADRLNFAVEDDGPGIDAFDLPLIFEKFYRGRRGAGRRKGTGMGLAIARAILIAHCGGIEVESSPGKGARFRFWVPLATREPDAAAKAAPCEQTAGSVVPDPLLH
jgi:two-component system sensor histidine kinase KdpD